MKFVVFNSDGMPIRYGHCPDEALDQQALEGETAVPAPSSGRPSSWRLVDGVAVNPE